MIIKHQPFLVKCQAYLSLRTANLSDYYLKRIGNMFQPTRLHRKDFLLLGGKKFVDLLEVFVVDFLGCRLGILFHILGHTLLHGLLKPLDSITACGEQVTQSTPARISSATSMEPLVSIWT